MITRALQATAPFSTRLLDLRLATTQPMRLRWIFLSRRTPVRGRVCPLCPCTWLSTLVLGLMLDAGRSACAVVGLVLWSAVSHHHRTPLPADDDKLLSGRKRSWGAGRQSWSGAAMTFGGLGTTASYLNSMRCTALVPAECGYLWNSSREVASRMARENHKGVPRRSAVARP